MSDLTELTDIRVIDLIDFNGVTYERNSPEYFKAVEKYQDSLKKARLAHEEKTAGLTERFTKALHDFRTYAKFPDGVNVFNSPRIISAIKDSPLPPRKAKPNSTTLCSLCSAKGNGDLLTVNLAPEKVSCSPCTIFGGDQPVCKACVSKHEMVLKTCAVCRHTKAYRKEVTFPTKETEILHACGAELFICSNCVSVKCNLGEGGFANKDCTCCVCDKTPDIAVIRSSKILLQVCLECLVNTPTEQVIGCVEARAKKCAGLIKEDLAKTATSVSAILTKSDQDAKDFGKTEGAELWPAIRFAIDQCEELVDDAYHSDEALAHCHKIVKAVEDARINRAVTEADADYDFFSYSPGKLGKRGTEDVAPIRQLDVDIEDELAKRRKETDQQ